MAILNVEFVTYTNATVEKDIIAITKHIHKTYIEESDFPGTSHVTRSRVDCGSDYEILIAKFRLKLRKVGKTARSFTCDLNQIPYDYTVTNKFKG